MLLQTQYPYENQAKTILPFSIYFTNIIPKQNYAETVFAVTLCCKRTHI